MQPELRPAPAGATVAMEPEWQITPKTFKLRVVLDHPTPQQVRDALDTLLKTGAPDHAVISFNPWNTPNDRYYVVATWTEEP